ncbi:MAG: hypothetical protein K2X77_24920 [Candidatus Obscuribacterales bacterium]|nr:hypothetical protein [Candidatus Obscuribacterales bacterium]
MIKLEPWTSYTTPRRMMVIAFVLQFLTLFILVKDSDSFGTLAVSLPSTYSSGWTHGTYWIGDPEKTGFQARPLSILVLPALFIMFSTKNYERPWWHKNGYLLTVGIMLFFTTGGAMFRELGGFINISAFILACVAAYKHSKWLKGAGKATEKNSTGDLTDSPNGQKGPPILPGQEREHNAPPPELADEPGIIESIQGIKKSMDLMDPDRKPTARRSPRTGSQPNSPKNDQFFEEH